MDNVEKRMEEIRKKYNVTREQLDIMGMDEFDYQATKERTKKNYLKGLLFDVVDPSCSIETIADNIIEACKIESSDNYQKIILGEISDCAGKHIGKSIMVSVSCKIAKYLQENP